MRRFRFVFTLITAVLFTVTPLYAQTAQDLQANIDSLSSQIQALDKEIASYNKQISATQGEAKTLKAALASLELRRAALVKEINRTKLQIKETEGNIVITQGKITQTQTKIETNKTALAETLRTLVYQDADVPVFVQSLATGAHFSDMIDRLKRSSEVSNAIHEHVQDLASAKQELDVQKEIYVTSKDRLVSLSDTLNDQKALVDATSKEKSTLLTETKNKESEYQKLLASRQKQKDQLEAEMLDVESRLKAFTNVSSLPKTGKGVLKYPLSSVNITQYFGTTAFSTANPQVYNGMGHNGIDLAAKVGTPVLAAADGVVVGTGNTDTACNGVSFGKWVLIRHNNGLSSLVAHLSVIQATPGQTVKAGDKIGLSGNTGYSTGPHVHFTVYASEAVHIAGPTEYKSKVCGTYLIMPLAPVSGYLNPLSYL